MLEGMVTSWAAIGKVVRRTVPDGPMLSPDRAQAAVARTRSGLEWAWHHLELAGPVPLVVDRSSIMLALAQDLQKTVPQLAPVTYPQAVRTVAAWATLTQTMLGTWWRPWPLERLALAAPNIWVTGRDRYFDQNDYARLVALRAAKWGQLLERHPWIHHQVVRGLGGFPRRSGELIRTAALFDQVVEMELDYLTPRVIPSINWLRKYQIPLATSTFSKPSGNERPRLSELQDRAREFVTFGKGRSGIVPSMVLTVGPQYFPSQEELINPEQWYKRVNES